jgi:[acyl-carrier-protein] S-malonyltransferase
MLAIVFSGQGTQFSGMGRSTHAVMPDLFHIAGEQLRCGLDDLFLDREAQCEDTRLVQPALFTLHASLFRCFAAHCDVAPSCIAGHSLGEISALAAARAIDFEEALRFVSGRAALMADAAIPAGGMTAVAGFGQSIIERVCRHTEIAGLHAYIACRNSPEQFVVGGSAQALSFVEAEIKSLGGEAVRLRTAGPFHTPDMRTAGDALFRLAGEMRWRRPAVPVISNRDAAFYPDETASWPSLLSEHITKPVNWSDSIRLMYMHGVRRVLEIGAKPMLGAIIAATQPGIEVQALCEPGQLDTALAFAAKTDNVPAGTALQGRLLALIATLMPEGLAARCPEKFAEIAAAFEGLVALQAEHFDDGRDVSSKACLDTIRLLDRCLEDGAPLEPSVRDSIRALNLTDPFGVIAQSKALA